MAENSEISWTNHTFNPWMGCTKVSPACKNCYAERDFDHRYKKVRWGPNGTRVVTSEANWKKPLKWNSDYEKEFDLWDRHGRDTEPGRPRVFCASLADVFEDWDGEMHDHNGNVLVKEFENSFEFIAASGNGDYLVTMNDVRKRLFKMIDATPHLDWLLLTKRPENIRRIWAAIENDPHSNGGNFGMGHRKNVWLGTSVENQEQADKRIPELLKCRELASVLFLSCEPLLGPLKLHRLDNGGAEEYNCLTAEVTQPWHNSTFRVSDREPIDWVIAGGESGPNARPTHPDWFRSLRDQCAAAGVPFHFKQWGEWVHAGHKAVRSRTFDKLPQQMLDETCMVRVGKKNAGRLLDGVEHNEFPEVSPCPGT